MLPIAEVFAYAALYSTLLRLDLHPVFSAFLALMFAELLLVWFCILIKKLLVGSEWGSAHSALFWSWRHFTYFFAQDCFFAWCQRPLGMLSGTVLPNPALRWMGCRIGRRTLISDPLQASDWNAVSFGADCIIAGFLQFHSFENGRLRVKRAEIRNNSAVNFGATVMGGAVIEPETTLLPLSMVLKEMHMPTAIYEGSPAEPVSEAQHSSSSSLGHDRAEDAPGCPAEAAHAAERRPNDPHGLG
jgi:hypothetical protein